MALTDYHASSADWRGQLKKNERKTLIVITLFILIYLLVGLLVDIWILSSNYPGGTLHQYFHVLLTFQMIPYATIILGVIAVISIFITFAMYNRIMLLGTDYHEITPEKTGNLQETQLYNVVEEMKVAAGLRYMPKVYLINADYMNAFASGYSEKSAMVAITKGLMQKLNREELQAVMAHELSHIRHHDIKLTLTVAVLSNIILMVIDMLFYSVIFNKDNNRENNRFMTIIIILRYLLPFLTILLALFLSRTREYMADAGAVELMRENSPMAQALLKISDDHAANKEAYAKAYGQTPHEQIRQASYLFDPSDVDPVKSLYQSFSTHPSTIQRLKAIGFIKKT